MKKNILTFIFCVSAAWPSFAQNNMEAMRFLTITAMMQYGEKLYDRGDFDEASAVCNHVLTYDKHQAQALELLKEMGRAPAVVSIPVIKPRTIQPEIPAVTALPSVDLSDTESLNKAIEAKKQSIEKLKNQISQLKTNIASQSKGE